MTIVEELFSGMAEGYQLFELNLSNPCLTQIALEP
jgi:hypothetical protein